MRPLKVKKSGVLATLFLISETAEPSPINVNWEAIPMSFQATMCFMNSRIPRCLSKRPWYTNFHSSSSSRESGIALSGTETPASSTEMFVAGMFDDWITNRR